MKTESTKALVHHLAIELFPWHLILFSPFLSLRIYNPEHQPCFKNKGVEPIETNALK
jgi:hypothetical protein